MRSGLGLAWFRCPLPSAIKTSSNGRLRLGWATVRVELMPARPLQCYKCWAFGHTKPMCKSLVDRSGSCFRCGISGHVSSGCNKNPSCVVCSEAGFQANHRLGPGECRSMQQAVGQTIDHRPIKTGPMEIL